MTSAYNDFDGERRRSMMEDHSFWPLGQTKTQNDFEWLDNTLAMALWDSQTRTYNNWRCSEPIPVEPGWVLRFNASAASKGYNYFYNVDEHLAGGSFNRDGDITVPDWATSMRLSQNKRQDLTMTIHRIK